MMISDQCPLHQCRNCGRIMKQSLPEDMRTQEVQELTKQLDKLYNPRARKEASDS